MDEPHPDQKDQEVGRMEESETLRAAGEDQPQEIDDGDGVEQRHLALQRVIALLKQGASERGLRLADVEQAGKKMQCAGPHERTPSTN